MQWASLGVHGGVRVEEVKMRLSQGEIKIAAVQGCTRRRVKLKCSFSFLSFCLGGPPYTS